VKPNPNFYLAVSGAIPLLLIVLLAEGKLKFADETSAGQKAWVSMLAMAVTGEVAALTALAWGLGKSASGVVCFGLSALGLLLCLMMVMLLFAWQVLGEIRNADDKKTVKTVKTDERWLAIPAAILIIGGLLALMLPLC
jgi:hypothetical protein